MSKNFSFYLDLQANFSLCHRQNHVFCYDSSFWSCLLNILPAASKLNLGSNTIAFTLRSFWFEPRVYLGCNFDRGWGELNDNNSIKDNGSLFVGQFLDEAL